MMEPLIVDGDVAQLDVLLATIADLTIESERLDYALDTARTAAADLMLALHGRRNLTLLHNGIPYVAKVKTYTTTVCECHSELSCPAREDGPVKLVDIPKRPATYVRPLRT